MTETISPDEFADTVKGLASSFPLPHTTLPGTMTLEQFTALLQPLEETGYKSIYMDGSKGLSVFNLPPGWNVGLKEKKDTDPTDAKITMDDQTYSLTKGGILAITSAVGIPVKYVEKTPGPMIQSHLNYWSSHSPDITVKMLVKGTEALAVAKEGITPFSNIALLSEGVAVCAELLGEGVEPWISTLSTHDLNVTNIRLILPVEVPQVFEAKRCSEDTWYPGVQIRNSITGHKPLTVQGFLWNETEQFAVVSQHANGRYNRKTMGQDLAQVYEWTREAVGKVVEETEHEFEILESVVNEALDSPSQILADCFTSYRIPLKMRQPIIDELVETEDETYYGLACALAKASTMPDLPEHFASSGMEVAAHIAHVGSQRCNSCHRAFV